jgi:membrane protein YdbS with pleckstrin-like domain
MPELFVSKKKEEKNTEIKLAESDKNLVTLFSTFVENPTNISFHHRDKDEKILLFLRSHLITYLKWVAVAFVFALLPPIIFALGTENLPFPALPGDFTIIFILIYYLLLFGFIFSNFLTWFFNIFVLTQKRVIDIDFAGLVFHDVAETQFTLLQDVNYTQSGPIRHFFNYGDVFAQTAGGKENLEAMGVPKPSQVARFIVSHIGRGQTGGP